MAVITSETNRTGCYLGEGSPNNIVNEEIVVASGSGALKPGRLLGRITEGGTQTVAAAVAFGGNTGTGTVGSLTADTGAAPGTYKIVVIEPATDGGTFEVFRPDGSLDGTGAVGAAYNGTVNFTLSDATDFVAGDGFSIAVSYASSAKYGPHNPAAANGSEVAVAILYEPIDATSGDVKCVATVRGPRTISGPYLIYQSGISDADKAAAIQSLRDRGMAVLPQHA